MVTRAAGSARLKETLVSGLNSESRAAPTQEHRDGPQPHLRLGIVKREVR